MLLQLLQKLYHYRSKAPTFSGNIAEKIRRDLENKRSSNIPILCNLGCGARYHPDWINIDFHGGAGDVYTWDLRNKLPFPDQSCDVVYSSHAIEHFERAGARRFLQECRRVLKSKGIIRLVAPDLERIAGSYLACLDAAKRGQPGADAKYEWAVIELLDQLVRHQSGGEMLKHWCQPDVPAEDFVAARVGSEYWRARELCKGQLPIDSNLSAVEIGQFRLGGEVHQWMYDRYSLRKLMVVSGFQNVRSCLADDSLIEGFIKYRLDTEPDGSLYKPDSFFMEAVAP